ncbi:MAG: UDP-N-acetylmuramate--L-alanine ligase [Lachnospiraceae bacterium]|nr:UDP-N-acetylmuramate--L-alanine ligase [Lachnospiraceae bacterium]
MYKIDFNTPIHIHFIGIGGISMSGLAKLLKSRGFTISGSDWHESDLTRELETLGIHVSIGQHAENITKDMDLVVYTAAVQENNEEYCAARALGISLMPRSVLLGQIMKQYPHAAGIAGTHGKTTTTSLLSVLLLAGELDPTITVGGVLDVIGGNLRIGQSGYFVAEACEYTNTFLSLFPTDVIILNIEEDHLDFFKDLEDIRCSFAKYAALVPAEGTAYVNAEIEDYQTLFANACCTIASYGILDGTTSLSAPSTPYTYAAANVIYDNHGCGSFDFIAEGRFLGRIELGLIGRHNVSNALPAIALALKYGVSMETIQKVLPDFHGTRRRFEYKGTWNGVRIYDDYAHHPTEIRATLSSAAGCGQTRTVTVFQPHTYTRTKALLPEFAEALALSDVVVLAKIYAARETDTLGVSSSLLAEEISKKGKEVYYFETFSEIQNFLLQFCSVGDLLITMGAGDIVNVAENLLGK